MNVQRRVALLLLTLPWISHCALGPRTLLTDGMQYGRALGDTRKREILSTIVGLRYGDAPGFVNVTQIISSYTWQAGAMAQVNSLPDPGGPAAGAVGMISYSNHPTFTFAPVTGEAYAKAYIEPLPAKNVLPLANAGVPIDLLLRLALHSIGGFTNATLLGSENTAGSAQFFEVLHLLRRLQLVGRLAFAVNRDSGSVTMEIPNALNGEDAGDSELVQLNALLKLSGNTTSFELVSPPQHSRGPSIVIVTRSAFAILTDLSGEVDVPAEDIDRGATKTSIPLAEGEKRPVIVVHTSQRSLHEEYVQVRYRSRYFWIADTDFDSKYALGVLETLLDVSQVSDDSHAPVVTVPAQ